MTHKLARQSLHKLIFLLTSVKFYALVVTSVFLCLGRLSEQTWKETVVLILGIRTFDKIASKKQAKGQVVEEDPSKEES